MPEAKPVQIFSHRSGCPEPASEPRLLVAEEPLTIDVIGGESFTVMRTPGHDAELVLGFLFSEGLIDGLEEVSMLEECQRSVGRFRVRLAADKDLRRRRSMAVSSSCGLCGSENLDELLASLSEVEGGLHIAASVLFDLPSRFREGQPLFRQTGGSHAAALFDADGAIVVLREDLGRHNALDKAIGYALGGGIAMAGLGAFLSGRISLEMVVKAARAQIGLVAAVGAASSLAVEAATRLGITLCGFVRGAEISVYSNDRRISE